MSKHPHIMACLHKNRVVKTEPKEDEEAAAGDSRLPFSSDKPRYNKFNYKIKQVPDSWKESWKIIRSPEKISPDKFDEFVDRVLNYKAIETTTNKRSTSDIVQDIDDSQWMSWHEAEMEEGYYVLLAQVRANTVKSRPHPKLPRGHTISWPPCLQVYYVVEATKNIKQAENTLENHISTEHLDASTDFHNSLEAKKLKMQSHLVLGSGSSSSSGSMLSLQPNLEPEGMLGPPPPLSAEEIRDKAVLAHIRKAHNAWDKAKREFTSTITQSKNHENTKGCKFEKDLAAHVSKGEEDDAMLVFLEQKFMRGERFNADEVALASCIGTTLKETSKAGNKVLQAMKPWFII